MSGVGGPGGSRARRRRSTARDIERYAGLFASRTRVMKSSAMRDLMALTERPEVADVQSFGERLHATLKGVDSAGVEAAASRLAADLAAHGIEVESARPVLPTLEDVFIARIEGAL